MPSNPPSTISISGSRLAPVIPLFDRSSPRVRSQSGNALHGVLISAPAAIVAWAFIIWASFGFPQP